MLNIDTLDDPAEVREMLDRRINVAEMTDVLALAGFTDPHGRTAYMLWRRLLNDTIPPLEGQWRLIASRQTV